MQASNCGSVKYSLQNESTLAPTYEFIQDGTTAVSRRQMKGEMFKIQISKQTE